MATITEPTKIKLEFKEAVYMYGGDYNQGYNDGKDDGFEEGKKVGYDEGVEVGKANAPREERSVTYKANGSYEVLPTSSELLMEKVNVVVDIPDDGSYSEGYTVGYSDGEAYGKQNAPTEDLSVTLTSNGTYSYEKPTDKYYADVEVTVNVPSEKTPTQEKSINITKNGTEVVVPDNGYALDKVTVTTQIPERLPTQTKTIDIDENGTEEVTADSGYALEKVIINTDIDTRLPEQEKSLEVTENKIYEVTPDDGYALAKVTVTGNVAGSGGGDDELVKIKCASDGITALTGDYCRITNFMEEFDFAKFSELKPTDCTRLFSYYQGKKLVIKNFDTSEVTTMEYMFSNCQNLETLDLSSLDTSKVTNMYNMFSGCTKLKVLNLSGINTSNVTTMYGLFSNCQNLETLDLSSFNTSKVTNMDNMFYGINVNISLDLSSFDTSNVIQMSSMFNSQFNGDVIFGENWGSNPQNTAFYFPSKRGKKETLLDIANKIADKSDTSVYTGTYKVKFSTSMQSQFTEDELTSLANQFTSKNWTLAWG